MFRKGTGPGRETAIRALQAVGLDVKSIKDVTPYRITGAGLLRPAGYRNEEVEKDMKYTGPSCRICRRSGVKLFLKAKSA